MKLAKISLAAVVALGAFANFASATPLEEAIKNVDVSGYARYRYNNKHYTTKTNGVRSSHKGVKRNHNFKAVLNFKATYDDNFFGNLGLRYNASDTSGSTGQDNTNTTTPFSVYQIYLGYTVGNTTIIAGKQEMGVFFTDDAVGTGIKVLNADIPGLTLAAVAFDALEYNDTETDGALLPLAQKLSYKTGNVYGAAAIGAYDPLAFQLWYATVEDVADVIAFQGELNFGLTDDINLGAKVQYAHSHADKKLQNFFKDAADNTGANTLAETLGTNSVHYEDGNFYVGELNTSLYGLDLAVGYLGWRADKKGLTSFSFEDQGAYVSPGENFSDFADYTLLDGQGSFIYVLANYTFLDQFSVGMDYIQGAKKTKLTRDSDVDKYKYKEFTPRFAYDYSKKLRFSTFYAFSTEKVVGADSKNEDKNFRFEAKYSF